VSEASGRAEFARRSARSITRWLATPSHVISESSWRRHKSLRPLSPPVGTVAADCVSDETSWARLGRQAGLRGGRLTVSSPNGARSLALDAQLSQCRSPATKRADYEPRVAQVTSLPKAAGRPRGIPPRSDQTRSMAVHSVRPAVTIRVCGQEHKHAQGMGLGGNRRTQTQRPPIAAAKADAPTWRSCRTRRSGRPCSSGPRICSRGHGGTPAERGQMLAVSPKDGFYQRDDSASRADRLPTRSTLAFG